MKEHDKGQGSPDQKPTSQNNAYLKEQGKPSRGFTERQPEQPPHGGGINKPEPHPPKETPLALEPNLPGHDQQTANLDPEIEEMIRVASLGDPEEEKRLREECKESSSLREFFKNPGRFCSLTSPAPDFSKRQEKQD